MNDVTSIRSRFETLRKQTEEKKDSTRSLIEELADDIRDLRKRGISFKDILNAIKGENENLKLTESTLKRYLYECSPKKKTRKKSSAKTEQTEQIIQQNEEQKKEERTEQKTETKNTTTNKSKFATLEDNEA